MRSGPRHYPLPRAVALSQRDPSNRAGHRASPITHAQRRYRTQPANQARIFQGLGRGLVQPSSADRWILLFSADDSCSISLRSRRRSTRPCAKEPLIGICRGWKARSIRQDEDLAYVMLEPVDGDQPRPGRHVEASARYVVGCDGANSTIRDLLDLEIVDTGFTEPWLVVDLEIAPELNAALPFGQYLDPERPTSSLTGAHGRRRFEFMTLPGEGPEIAEEANVWRLTKKWGCTPENTRIVRRVDLHLPGPVGEPLAQGPLPAGRRCGAPDAAIHGPGSELGASRHGRPGLALAI